MTTPIEGPTRELEGYDVVARFEDHWLFLPSDQPSLRDGMELVRELFADEPVGLATMVDVRPHIRRTEHGFVPVVGHQRRAPEGLDAKADRIYRSIFGDEEFWSDGSAAGREKRRRYVEQAYQPDLSDLGIEVKVTQVRSEGRVTAVGSFRDRGLSVGTFLRSWSPPALYGDTKTFDVRHSEMAIHPQSQGQGIGTRFNDHAEAFYRRAGADRISLLADDTVGGYAWAAAGYDWNPAALYVGSETWIMVGELRESVGLEATRARPWSTLAGATLSDPEKERARDYLDALAEYMLSVGYAHEGDDPPEELPEDLPTPKDLASLGRDRVVYDGYGREWWWGKAMMMGRSWDGAKTL